VRQDKVPLYAYFLAFAAGALGTYAVWKLFAAVNTSKGIGLFLVFGVISGLTHGVLGACFGFVWPNGRWRWGVWVSLPFSLIIGLASSYVTLVFYNPRTPIKSLSLFFLYLLLVASTMITACVSAYVSSRLSRTYEY
jgi:hypothetical protein